MCVNQEMISENSQEIQGGMEGGRGEAVCPRQALFERRLHYEGPAARRWRWGGRLQVRPLHYQL